MILTELMRSNDREGPWRLYIYDLNSEYHSGGIWFADKPKYPEEGEITTAEARKRCESALAEGREVRVCDGGDMLVFHATSSGVLHGATFWDDVTRTA